MGILAGQAALAVKINGQISFTGGLDADTSTLAQDGDPQTTTQIAILGAAIQPFGLLTGDYAGVDTSSAVTFASPIDVLVGTNIGTLWSFTDATSGLTYSLDSAVVTSVDQSSGLFMSGTGYANISGPGTDFEATLGTWQLSSQSQLSFSAGTAVPDSGTTLAMLGLGLLIVGSTAGRLKAIAEK